jgi:hypothetical protein
VRKSGFYADCKRGLFCHGHGPDPIEGTVIGHVSDKTRQRLIRSAGERISNAYL